MAKRTAATDLNHDNWNDDDDPEDAGTFSRASEDTLKKRVIKVAKRRNPISTQTEEKSAVFGGFTGFSKPPTTSSGSFGFLSNISSKTEPKTNGMTEKKEPEKNLDEYYGKLKGLNESVSEWITKHVAQNPLVNLQPIFKDYDKYFTDLEKLKNDGGEKSEQQTPSSASTVTMPQFSFGSSSKFSFSTAPSSSISTPTDSIKPTFSFGSTTSGDSGKFSFTSTVIKPADNPLPSKEQDEETEEPTEEDKESYGPMKPVEEEGHVYSTRCKVFVKKEGNFADLGVGTLYLKPVADTGKIQLIVRAESNLGRLICNFILSESIPTKRMGKKDVMLVCIPTPEAQPPPVPILLRVKSPEVADELLSTLEKHKK